MTEVFMSLLYENLLQITLSVISIIITYYVIPAIKNVLIPWLKEKKLDDDVLRVCSAIEKLYQSGVIESGDKKAEAIKALEKCGIKVDDKVEIAIEAMVHKMDEMGVTFYRELQD